MIEVFRTNVKKKVDADRLIAKIERTFPGMYASFDLEDCDCVLRVTSLGQIEANCLIELIKMFGFNAEILTDEVPSSFNQELLDLLSAEIASS